MSDVGRLQQFKIAAIETGSGGRNVEFRHPANVRQCRQCHGRVRHDRKYGVAAGIGSQIHSVQLLFPFPVSVKAVIHYRQVPATCRRRQVAGDKLLVSGTSCCFWRQVACLRRQVAEVQHVQLSATCRQKQQLVSAVYQHLSPVSACRRFINIHDVSRGWSNKLNA